MSHMQSVQNTKILGTHEDVRSSFEALVSGHKKNAIAGTQCPVGPSFRVGSDIYNFQYWSIRERSLKVYLVYLHYMHAGDSKKHTECYILHDRGKCFRIVYPRLLHVVTDDKTCFAEYHLTQPELFLAYEMCIEQLSSLRWVWDILPTFPIAV